MSDFSTDIVLQDALKLYEKKFGSKPHVAVYAPGRVNLIGEHTDYNDGFVLPFALPFKTVIVGSKASPNGETTVHSVLGEDTKSATFRISEMKKEEPAWANYIKGTISQYKDDISSDAAFNIAICSDVPMGSGLSSSASLEVATATFIETICELGSKISGTAKALKCQKAEHEWADTPCGIMDQYISAMGVKSKLLLIDCRTNEYRLVPFGPLTTETSW